MDKFEMDQLQLLEFCKALFPTEAGADMGQAIYQMVTQGKKREELLEEAGKAFLLSDYTPEGCDEFQEAVRQCLQDAPEEFRGGLDEKVVNTICTKLDTELPMITDVFQAIDFFYKTMMLLESVANIDGREVFVNIMCQETARHLWMKLFIDTRIYMMDGMRTVDLLKDLRELAVNNIEINPAFSYYILEDLLRGFQMMHFKFTKQQNINLAANMYLLMAKCSFQAEQYKLTTAHCEKASQLFDCNNYLPYELWAMALHRSGQYQAAIKRLESARECAKDSGVRRHLKEYLDEIHKDMAVNTQKVSSEPDDEWLAGTNVHTTQQQQARAQQAKNAHVKKKKHSRPSREVVELPKLSPNDWKIGTSGKKKAGAGESAQTGGHGSVPAHLSPENNPLLQYTDWDTSSEDDSSDAESAVSVAVLEVEEKEPVVTKVKVKASDRTWYEESHEMYLNGEEDDKIVCGMWMDVDIDSILAHPVEKRAPFYRPMESEDNMKRLMRTMPDRYKHCRIELDQCHKAVCKVVSSDEQSEIEIHGRSKCGQTFNQDFVCVEILAKPKPHSTFSHVLTKRTEDDNKVYGQVIGVLRSNFKANQHPVLACTCDDEDGFLMHPLCKSVPKIHALNGRTKKKYPSLSKYRIDTYRIDDKGQLQFKKYFDVKPGLRGRYVFVVVYLTWGVHHVYPLGAVVDVLECGTDFNGGMKILEMQYQVPSNFTRGTVRHIDKMLKKKAPTPSNGRVDCRDLTVFTIDPEHSKDLDDALSICKEDDHYIVGVHIADVAAVVQKDDPVDKEAKRRATSFYPCESRVRHMLPEPLSEQLCSLKPNEDKCALSVFFHIEESGTVREAPSVKRTLIRSSQKLSYKDAQKVIEGETVESVPKSIRGSINLLHRIAQNLRNSRIKDSRFAVPFEDPRFLDNEALEEAHEAHALIEEFMIKANTFIADWLKKKYPARVPIRCQSEPPKEELQKFVQAEDKFLDLVVGLQGREILPARKVAAENVVAKGNSVRKEALPVQKNIWLQILEGVHAGKMKDAMKALCQDEVHPFQAVILDHWRSIMESAEYKCSVEPERILHHFSLQTKLYTHFTSPIRRYVDLVVHRLVHAALDEQQCPYTPQDVSEMCAYINNATARQKHFSNGCQALKRAEKIAQQPMTFKAFVSNLTDSGAELCIPSLKHISGRSKELPFNLMDFSTKPEEKTDAVSGKTIVRGKWKKRLYDCVGCPDQLLYSKANERLRYNPEVEVDPHQYVFFVDSQTWAKTMTACFNEDVKNLKKILNSQPEEGQDGPRTGQHRTFVTSEYGDGTVKYQQCKFDYCFSPGRVIKVQMVANPLSGLLTPQVRLFHVSKNLSLCLTHMENPVGVLSKYATESSKKNIESIAEYQRIWLPLLEMEAATSAVHSEENVIINNVNLDFKRSQGKTRTFYNGSFTLPAKFVSDRYIEFSGLPIESLTKKQLDEEDDKSFGKKDFSSVDYLCIRCPMKQAKIDGKGESLISQNQVRTSEKETKPIPSGKKHQRSRSRSRTRSKATEGKNPKQEVSCIDQCQNEDPYTWVGHGQIVRVRRWKSDHESEFVTVTFTLNANSSVVPDSLIPAALGTVEVIFKSMVDRTSMAMIQNLSSSKLDVKLANCIALHRGTPKLGGDRFDVGMKIEKEVYIGNLPMNNQNQLVAIEKAVSSSFTLIQGPPGTGKTYTGIKLMFLFNKINKIMEMEGVDAKKKQVLFCGPSNKAVDLVACYMLNRLGESCPKIIRVYGSNIESQDYPIPKRNFMSKRSTHDLKSDPRLFEVTLHHMVRMQTNPKSSEIRTYDAFFKKNSDAVTIGHIKKYRKILFAAYCEELKKCDIVLCTCAVGGNMKLSKATDIQQVVIDESAMSTEPQSMVPIIASGAKQVVLIGDHKQLRPIIQCKEAAELGLDRSLFERYAAQATFLNIQYRMHPRICEFPSEMFYKGKLETAPSISWKTDTPLSLWPVENVPHVLCHVEGAEESLAVSTEEGNEQSKSNSAEVDKVEEVYNWLVKKEKVNPNYINVMSQYNAQCSKIKEKLTKYHNQKNIHVNTVVASQGGEWDYVIFSTVRSLPEYKIEKNPTLGWSKHNLGFITDQNQINVALTRARKGLIIIGNQNLLRSDKVFRELIVKYEKQGCLVDGTDFPRRRTHENRKRRAQIPGAEWKEV